MEIVSKGYLAAGVRPMSKRKFLLLLKPFEGHRQLEWHSTGVSIAKSVRHLEDRTQVHKEAVTYCKDVLKRKLVDWEPLFRDNLTKPIRNVDLVITVGGDGTLLQATHFMDDSVPVLGVNSDPTRPEEVKISSHEYDAARSTGYLCAATTENFEKILDDILENRAEPSQISRISTRINSQQIPTHALNDILIAHPCPASVSRLSFRLRENCQPCTPLVFSRSSGLRVSTAAGSTAAMQSAGGFRMPIVSKDLQYMVREPLLSPGAASAELMHGLVKSDQVMETTWLSDGGVVYVDGSHIVFPIQHGDVIELSSDAPVLKIFLSDRSASSQRCRL